ALDACCDELESESRRLTALRKRLYDGLCSALGGITLTGHSERRLPGHLNLSIAGIEGDSLLMSLQDIAMSTTSACSSALRKPSHVLTALGLTEEQAFSAIRIGIGRFNTEEEIDYGIGRIAEVAAKQRRLSMR